jgi:hypothetical protein
VELAFPPAEAVEADAPEARHAPAANGQDGRHTPQPVPVDDAGEEPLLLVVEDDPDAPPITKASPEHWQRSIIWPN